MLTASGGPFRGWSAERLGDVTPEQALAHPTWSMGPVISINSATLVNKGLEVIEAHLLFGLDFDRIEVVVHPTSVVHSMVEFVDGSTIVQASPPTMRIPIALALAWPDRVPDAAAAVDWTRPETWEFFPLDDAAFPAVGPRPAAGSAGGTAPAAYNAANEVCVEAFLGGRLSFADIVPTVREVLEAHAADEGPVPSKAADLTVDDVLAVDAWARERARSTPALPVTPPADQASPRRNPMTPLLYLLGVVVFVVAILVSIGLHELGHMIPAKAFGGKVTQYFIGFGPTVWSKQVGETEYGAQGRPARRLRQDRRHAAAGRRRPRRGGVRRARRARPAGPQVQHGDVHPADLRRARGRVGARQARRRGPPVLPDGVVEEGRRDGRRPDGQHR